MRFFCSLLCLLALGVCARAKEFKLYAALLEDTPVELSTGARWMMDKSEVFPVIMYKERQTRIVLQLDDTDFRTETRLVRILKNEEVPAGLEKYRQSVENYRRTQKAKSQKTSN